MSNDILTRSEFFKGEYSCRIHRIGTVTPVENSDNLMKTIVGGDYVVIGKDTHEGDVYFYVNRECVINPDFLRVNNLFMFDKRELNANYEEVEKLLAEAESLKENDPEKSAEIEKKAKYMCGYFGENGRCRAKTLRGQLSSGFLFGLDAMLKWKPELKQYFDEHPMESFAVNVEEQEEFMFDTINGELFVWPYVPKTNAVGDGKKKKKNKDAKRMKKFTRIDDAHFQFHYDTAKLADNLWRIKPDDIVDISVKEHGTSVILSNIMVKNLIKLPFYKKIYNNIVDAIGLEKYRCTDYYLDYGNVYSSRHAIQNGTIDLKENPDAATYYGHNVYRDINDIFKDFIPKNYTLYGEIVGFVNVGGKGVQKGYDYGCDVNGIKGPVNKLLIYRISEELEDGTKKEWNISEVIEWTEKLREQLPEENKNRLAEFPLLYHGKLCDLYPEIDTKTHWNENVLLAMMNDREHFGMEEKETLCTAVPKKKQPPREGIVVRVEVDHNAEVEPAIATQAFKLKTEAFAKREAKQYDAGEVDMEAAGTDYATPDA